MKSQCKAKCDPDGVAIRCVRQSGHPGKHLSSASRWVDASSEEPIPGFRGIYRMEWSRPRRESPTFVKVKSNEGGQTK